MYELIEEKKKARYLLAGDHIIHDDDLWCVTQTIETISGTTLVILAYWKWDLTRQSKRNFITPRNDEPFRVFRKPE